MGAEAGRETGALGWAGTVSAPVVRADAAGEQAQQEDEEALGSLWLASSADPATQHSIPAVFLLKSCKTGALHSFW